MKERNTYYLKVPGKMNKLKLIINGAKDED